MQTFLVERNVPARFDAGDPDAVALHCRWALDSYVEVGAAWLGGVVTDSGMFSLVAAEDAEDLRRHWRALGIGEEDARLRRVIRAIGPSFALPRGHPQYRPPLR